MHASRVAPGRLSQRTTTRPAAGQCSFSTKGCILCRSLDGRSVRSPPYGRVFMAAFDRISSDDWERLAPALDARIDDLSPEQRAIAVGRAQRRAGVAKLDATDEEHLRILWDELRAVVLRASLARLVAKRELEVAGVAASGHVIHRPRFGYLAAGGPASPVSARRPRVGHS